jgi:hypothetical protein
MLSRAQTSRQLAQLNELWNEKACAAPALGRAATDHRLLSDERPALMRQVGLCRRRTAEPHLRLSLILSDITRGFQCGMLKEQRRYEEAEEQTTKMSFPRHQRCPPREDGNERQQSEKRHMILDKDFDDQPCPAGADWDGMPC